MLESEEPSHQALPAGGDALEHLVAVYALVFARPFDQLFYIKLTLIN